MSFLWVEHVDGINILPKLPCQLRQHHRLWRRNRAVSDAVKNMKTEQKRLESLSTVAIPEDLIQREGSKEVAHESKEMLAYATMPEAARLQFPVAYQPEVPLAFALRLVQLHQRSGMYIDTEYCGDPRYDAAFSEPPVARKRKRRSCGVCGRTDCIGRGKRALYRNSCRNR